MSAFILWRSMPRVGGHPHGPLIVRRDEGAWRWCGGFAGMPAPTDAYLEARVLPDRIPDEAIRLAMWAEAMDPAGVETAHLPLWLDHVRRRLPDDLMQQIFGNRGPGASAIARIWGVSRQTVSRHLGTRGDIAEIGDVPDHE